MTSVMRIVGVEDIQGKVIEPGDYVSCSFLSLLNEEQTC